MNGAGTRLRRPRSFGLEEPSTLAAAEIEDGSDQGIQQTNARQPEGSSVVVPHTNVHEGLCHSVEIGVDPPFDSDLASINISRDGSADPFQKCGSQTPLLQASMYYDDGIQLDGHVCDTQRISSNGKGTPREQQVHAQVFGDYDTGEVIVSAQPTANVARPPQTSPSAVWTDVPAGEPVLPWLASPAATSESSARRSEPADMGLFATLSASAPARRSDMPEADTRWDSPVLTSRFRV